MSATARTGPSRSTAPRASSSSTGRALTDPMQTFFDPWAVAVDKSGNVDVGDGGVSQWYPDGRNTGVHLERLADRRAAASA